MIMVFIENNEYIWKFTNGDKGKIPTVLTGRWANFEHEPRTNNTNLLVRQHDGGSIWFLDIEPRKISISRSRDASHIEFIKITPKSTIRLFNGRRPSFSIRGRILKSLK